MNESYYSVIIYDLGSSYGQFESLTMFRNIDFVVYSTFGLLFWPASRVIGSGCIDGYWV